MAQAIAIAAAAESSECGRGNAVGLTSISIEDSFFLVSTVALGQIKDVRF